MMYLASIPDADVKSSEISDSLCSIDPLPSSSGSFLRFSMTFWVVSLLENNVFCFFDDIICSATFPKSPSSFHFWIIKSVDIPDALDRAFMQSFSDIPNSLSS